MRTFQYHGHDAAQKLRELQQKLLSEAEVIAAFQKYIDAAAAAEKKTVDQGLQSPEQARANHDRAIRNFVQDLRTKANEVLLKQQTRPDPNDIRNPRNQFAFQNALLNPTSLTSQNAANQVLVQQAALEIQQQLIQQQQQLQQTQSPSIQPTLKPTTSTSEKDEKDAGVLAVTKLIDGDTKKAAEHMANSFEEKTGIKTAPDSPEKLMEEKRLREEEIKKRAEKLFKPLTPTPTPGEK